MDGEEGERVSGEKWGEEGLVGRRGGRGSGKVEEGDIWLAAPR